jgi:beta-glucosidase
MTVNEPNSVIANGYITGVWPPQKKNIFLALRAYKNLASAHVRAYQLIKKIYPEVQVGCTEIFTFFEPYSATFFLDRWICSLAFYIGNEKFLSRVTGFYDFLGVQNYFFARVGMFGREKREFVSREKRSDLGWEICGDSLGKLLTQCSRYRVPLYVTEDGLADADDTKRGKYLSERIASLQQAHDQGVDVRGYFVWSLLDNFEWDKGFWPRFGLISVDRKTLRRKPRGSFFLYKEIIER